MSYDKVNIQTDCRYQLKGHQIIGELRQRHQSKMKLPKIEGSPDHWWVTTPVNPPASKRDLLKGHQIIGELRLLHSSNHLCSFYWRVTRSLVSYDFPLFKPLMLLHWRVTRSLVSYDGTEIPFRITWWLKGHQIIGELRRLSRFLTLLTRDWRVTRSLVSYDVYPIASITFEPIEGSPDHWWVTTSVDGQLWDKDYWRVTRSLVSYDYIHLT